MTPEQIEEVETVLGYYQQHGVTRFFEEDMISILRDLLPDDSHYKNVEVKS